MAPQQKIRVAQDSISVSKYHACGTVGNAADVSDVVDMEVDDEVRDVGPEKPKPRGNMSTITGSPAFHRSIGDIEEAASNSAPCVSPALDRDDAVKRRRIEETTSRVPRRISRGQVVLENRQENPTSLVAAEVAAKVAPTVVVAIEPVGCRVVRLLCSAASELRAISRTESPPECVFSPFLDHDLLKAASDASNDDVACRLLDMCRERGVKWLSDLEKLEAKLVTRNQDMQQGARHGCPKALLQDTREAGVSFGRALEYIVSGLAFAPDDASAALTLEDELTEFASSSMDGFPAATASEKKAAIADVFGSFGGLKGYGTYLHRVVGLPGAEVPLSGRSAWQRLLSEIEVSVKLAHLPENVCSNMHWLMLPQTGVGDDAIRKLMFSVAFSPLRRRGIYVAMRVCWMLGRLRDSTPMWMKALSQARTLHFGSPVLKQHSSILESHSMMRSLVARAVCAAVETSTAQLFKSLECTVIAGCQSPHMLIRGDTRPGPSLLASTCVGASVASSQSDIATIVRIRVAQSRRRVMTEMLRRQRAVRRNCPGVSLHENAMKQLSLCFNSLRDALSANAVALSSSTLTEFCSRRIDAALVTTTFTCEEKKALEARHLEFVAVAKRQEALLHSSRRCMETVRDAVSQAGKQ
eukprot:TRINITY_DN32695_c0_g1_i1.p1 TRINITY_DN32695_c0_g1~~TRINITY_DN32695_c0_g1_i1.p1  ORF type:complete len:708 (+),score=139.02 TRINITY_DN32695_c0_g1_i1:207-2126(+)